MPEKGKLFYKGRPVEELTKEELIEALHVAYEQYTQAVKQHMQSIELLST